MNCNKQDVVLEAVKTGKWNNETRTHFESCTICREEAKVWSWLKSFAQETEKEANPAAYGLIWLKAQFMEKQEAQRRALRPLVIFQISVCALLGLVLLFLTLENWPLIQVWVTQLMADGPTDSNKVDPASFPAGNRALGNEVAELKGRRLVAQKSPNVNLFQTKFFTLFQQRNGFFDSLLSGFRSFSNYNPTDVMLLITWRQVIKKFLCFLILLQSALKFSGDLKRNIRSGRLVPEPILFGLLHSGETGLCHEPLLDHFLHPRFI